MLILAVESSCDETAVALVRDGREVLTDQIFSQAALHAVYGGVVPEIASRSHVEVISQLADRALAEAGVTRKDIDAVAVTCAPGLIGALLVGVNFAKSAALALGVPLIPVHHIRGHIAARESHVLDILKQNKDSLLHIADQPPYIIQLPE
jgi:N6-L-threonylcarbamoyladenine synthase